MVIAPWYALEGVTGDSRGWGGAFGVRVPGQTPPKIFQGFLALNYRVIKHITRKMGQTYTSYSIHKVYYNNSGETGLSKALDPSGEFIEGLYLDSQRLEPTR